MNFGLASMDDSSVQRVLNSVVATQPRPYVVMEVKSNLLKDERHSLLKRFTRNSYKRVAHVIMGEPPEDFKAKTHEIMLKEKQDKLEGEWRIRLRQAKREKERTGDKSKKDDEESKTKPTEEVKKEGE